MSKRDDHNPNMWRDAVDAAAKQFKHGDLISDAWLFSQFDIEMPSEDMLATDAERIKWQFRAMFTAFYGAMLTQHQMALSRVRNEGYRILKPEEQTDSFLGAFVDDLDRSIRRTQAGLKNVKRSGLTSEQIKRNEDAQGRVASLAMFAGKKLAGHADSGQLAESSLTVDSE